ncbi:MAG: CheR-type methyltransferase protein [Candidatus Brocadiaceae bacterium]|nr:CheR-type methyltransferase protein [Candidatus Brocadiaceae bacterium]
MHTNDEELKRLLQKVFEERGLDFRAYNKTMLKRRLARRLCALRTESYKEYARTLDTHLEEYKELFDSLIISVSHFFRNPLTFEFLYEVILPEMITYKEQSRDAMIRVWSAGCAHGEEPYSVAILLAELLGERLKDYRVTIYATDIDTNALNEAKVGQYTEDSILEVKKGILNKYFHHKNGYYQIGADIKALVDFCFHDLTSEKVVVPSQSVFTNFDLILCRNVLIYFNQELQKRVINNLKTVLNEKGYLVLGEAEILTDDGHSDIICRNGLCKIYQKTSQGFD